VGPASPSEVRGGGSPPSWQPRSALMTAWALPGGPQSRPPSRRIAGPRRGRPPKAGLLQAAGGRHGGEAGKGEERAGSWRPHFLICAVANTRASIAQPARDGTRRIAAGRRFGAAVPPRGVHALPRNPTTRRGGTRRRRGCRAGGRGGSGECRRRQRLGARRPPDGRWPVRRPRPRTCPCAPQSPLA